MHVKGCGIIEKNNKKKVIPPLRVTVWIRPVSDPKIHSVEHFTAPANLLKLYRQLK